MNFGSVPVNCHFEDFRLQIIEVQILQSHEQ